MSIISPPPKHQISNRPNKMQYKDVFDMDFAHHNNNNNNNEGGGHSSNGNAASSGCNEVGSTSSNSTSHAHVVSASLAAGEEGSIVFFIKTASDRG